MSLCRVGFCVLTVVLCLIVIGSPATTQESKPDSGAPYLNPALGLDQRVDDLISRLTLEEKVSQMMNAAPPIPRVGIPQYDWWNEALHGVAFSGVATVFPQAIGLAATWDIAGIFMRTASFSDGLLVCANTLPSGATARAISSVL